MIFRVWDKVKVKYDANNVSLEQDGQLSVNGIIINEKDFEVEFNTGITLADGTETFYGDIIRLTDSNWGYGGEYDKTHDSYQYIVITEDNIYDMINYWLCDGNVWHSDLELVGNIHETELTDVMKVWIKE